MKKGAITVFMLLITTSILTLGGVMIDLGRIILADYAVASMSESATRSMMANYNADLIGEYGLFAIEDTKENRDEFTKYLKRNLNSDENNNAIGKNFSLLKFKNASLVEDEIVINFSKPISDQQVFKEQVKEYHTPRTIAIGVDRIISQVSSLLKSKAIESLSQGSEKAKNAGKKVVSQADSANTKLQMFKKVTSNSQQLVELKWNKAYASLEKSITSSLGKKGISAVFDVANKEIFKKREFTDVMGLDDAAEEALTELDLMLETVENTDQELKSIKADSSVEEYVQSANKNICTYIKNNNGERMGSTMAALCISPKEREAVAANVGDGKVYLFRDGRLKKLSEDHNQAQSMVNIGIITEEEARTHKDKSKLTQFLGIFQNEMIIEPFLSDNIMIRKNDIFLLCSDGLTDMLTHKEIEEILSGKNGAGSKVRSLVECANQKGGNDNITVILAQVV